MVKRLIVDYFPQRNLHKRESLEKPPTNDPTHIKLCIICELEIFSGTDYCRECRGGVFLSGKYTGECYRWVVDNDPNYCSYMTYGVRYPSRNTKKFVEWMEDIRYEPEATYNDDTIVKFGKNKGLSFAEIAKMKNYSQYVVNSSNPKGQFLQLQIYLIRKHKYRENGSR